MCHHCVIESVKQRLLSRRDLFKAAPAVAVAAAATGIATPALATSHSGVTDLTHEFYNGFPTYFGPLGITLTAQFNFKDNGLMCSLSPSTSTPAPI